MANVFPFHGYRYNPDVVGNLDRVVTQPYDKIDEEDRKRYYDESPYNIVRVILNREPEGEKDKYKVAGETLEEWIEEGALVQEEEPCIYVYNQEYHVDGEKKVRKGFIGLGELQEGEGVKAHEDTMEGPKADRLNLMRATEANFGHIFMLYPDSKQEVNSRLEEAVSGEDPTMEVKDEDRNSHRLWKITDQDLIEEVRKKMEDKELYIADGHHRYETALNYRNECREKGWESPGPEGFGSRMMTFVSTSDPGLEILATHRLIYGLEDFNPRKLLEEAREDFAISRFGSKEKLYEKLDEDRGEKSTIGFRAKKDKAYWALTLQDQDLVKELIPDRSEAWRNLDVTVLHKAILEGYLDIEEEKLAEKEVVDYIRYRDRALDLLGEENYDCAFILNPTRMEEVTEIADGGEKMPSKSTDFYPKLLTGMVLHKLKIDRE